MEIRYKKLRHDAKTPYKKFEIDAGFDLTAIWKEDTDKYTVYGTGIALEIPPGYVGLMFPRSSVTNQDLMLKNCVGVIDASYRGEIMCRFAKYHHDQYIEGNGKFVEYVNGDQAAVDRDFVNFSEIIFRMPDYYEIGDRVCQIVFVEIPFIQLVEAEELSDTERGTAGYGSSGK
jgi:dUTP pyrophosphatase